MTPPIVLGRIAKVVIVAALVNSLPFVQQVSAVPSVNDGDKCSNVGVKIAGGSGVTFICTKLGTKNVLKWKRTATTTTIPRVDAVSQIVIKDFSFTVAVGIKGTDALSVINRDTSTHTVTSDTGAFNVSVAGGTTKSLPSLKSGNYEFHCEIHTSMRGTITIL